MGLIFQDDAFFSGLKVYSSYFKAPDAPFWSSFFDAVEHFISEHGEAGYIFGYLRHGTEGIRLRLRKEEHPAPSADKALSVGCAGKLIQYFIILILFALFAGSFGIFPVPLPKLRILLVGGSDKRETPAAEHLYIFRDKRRFSDTTSHPELTSGIHSMPVLRD